MNFIKYGGLILIFFVFSIFAECDDPSIILPCTGCHYNNIICSGVTDIELATIFRKLSSHLKDAPQQKRFKYFKLENSFIKSIEADTFQDITFQNITISGSKLNRIDRDAFGPNFKEAKIVDIINSPNLPAENIFAVVKKFTNLVTLNLKGNNITEIPEFAFKNSQEITLSSTLMIDLGNNKLKGTSFLQNSFAGISRPTNIVLDGNLIEFLSKKSFLPFLTSNSKNRVQINPYPTKTSLDCMDCRSFWVKQHPEIKPQISVLCSDNRALEDLTHFRDCLTYNMLVNY